jgi:hypothetical protein
MMMSAAEVAAIGGPLVPCLPGWAPEKSAYIAIFEAAEAEFIFAQDYPQLLNLVQNLTVKLREAGATVTRVAVLFATPDDTPLRLFSHDGDWMSQTIAACADDGYILAAVFDPFLMED